MPDTIVITQNPKEFKVGVAGAPGPSFADVARNQGSIHGVTVASDDTDAEVLDKLAEAVGVTPDMEEAVTSAEEAAAAAAESAAAFDPVFVQYDDSYTQRVVKDLKLFGAKHRQGHQYIIGLCKTTTAVAEVRIKSLTENIIVATAQLEDPDYGTGTELRIRIDPAINFSGWTGMTGYVVLDLTQVVESPAVYQPTTMAEAGIKDACLFSLYDMRELFRHDVWGEIIKVPAGGTNLRDAVEALYDVPLADPNGIAVLPTCARANAAYRIGLLLAAGNHYATNLHLPDFVDPLGEDRFETVISKENDTARPLIQGHLNHKCIDLELYSNSSAELYSTGVLGQYAWHSDWNNLTMTPDAAGDVNYRIDQLWRRVRFRSGPSSNVALLGAGISAPSTMRVEDCSAYSEKADRSAPFLSCHTTADTMHAARFEIDGFTPETDHGETWYPIAVQSEQPDFVQPAQLQIDRAPLVRQVGSSGAVPGGWTFHGEWFDQTHPKLVTVTGTTRTLALADAAAHLRCTNASAVTITVPPNASVAFKLNTEITIEQGGTGTVTVAPGSGVTVNSRGGLNDIAGQHGVAFLKKVGTNTWTLGGDLA